MAAWAVWSASKRSHTASLSLLSMSIKFGKAASLFRALVPVIRFSVETLGSGHFSVFSIFGCHHSKQFAAGVIYQFQHKFLVSLFEIVFDTTQGMMVFGYQHLVTFFDGIRLTVMHFVHESVYTLSCFHYKFSGLVWVMWTRLLLCR